jgi:Uma2 family endonuclease
MTIAAAPSSQVETQPLLLDVRNTTLSVTLAQFERLCIDNPDLRLELTPNRELMVMAPAGGESSERNLDLAIDVGIWNRQTDLFLYRSEVRAFML